MLAAYDQVRDFLELHYKATERNDSPFWNYCRSMTIPDSLQYKLDLFQPRGRLFRYDDELFSVTSWIAVLLGQGVVPDSFDDIVHAMTDTELGDVIQRMRDKIAQTAERLPAQSIYLDKHCRARTV